MLTQTKIIGPEELLQYEDITKDFDLKYRRNISKKMKIRYNNPDDEDKTFIIDSTDPIITIRTKQLTVKSKTGEYIRFVFNIPSTVGVYTPNILVKNVENNEVEEVLRFNIEVN